MTLPYELNDATRSTVSRVRVVKVDDKKSQQFVNLKVRKSEEHDKVLSIQPHGFSSNPPNDTEGVLIQMGGRSDRSLLLLGSHEKHRPKETKAGGALLYDDKGNVVYSRGEDGISVNAKTGVVEVRSQNDKVTVKPGGGKNVYLGGDGTDGSYAKVMTESGPSINVYAKIG